MKPLNFPAVKLAFLLVSGILLGYLLNTGSTIALLISMFSILLLAVAYVFSNRKSILFGICAALSTLSTGVLGYSLAVEGNHSGHYRKEALSGEQLWHLKITTVEKHSSFYRVYGARVLSLDQKPTRGSIQLRIKQSDSEPLKIDDEILVLGKAQEVTMALNPYQWDYKKYLKKRNIHHQIRTSIPYIYPLNPSQRTIRGWASKLRYTLLGKLEKTAIPERELSIVKAILLGDRGDITTDTLDTYKKAGAIHILAISGLHVGIILLLLRFLFHPLTWLSWGRPVALLLSVALLWVYALLAGFGPSVIRAVAMFSFLAYSVFLNRITHGYNTLALSVLFLLLVINPLLVFEAGFQMSYAAVCAILWVYPVLLRIWQPRMVLIKRIWQVAAVSLAAQLGVLPVSLYYFHQFPGLFLLSSLVVIPFLGIILGTGFIVSFLALLNRLPELLTDFYSLILRYMNEFIGWISGMDSFFLEDLPFGFPELLLTYLLIYCLISLLIKPKGKMLRLGLICFLSIQLCGIFHVWDTQKTNRMWITHQYGDPLLIKQNGIQLTAYSPTGTIHQATLRNHELGARTREFEVLPLKKSYMIKGKSLIRMDSSLILPSERELGYLWLTHAPKVNLDRYLTYYSPGQIIADGSNPPYLINKWEESARRKNIPFHYTGHDGAYEFSRSYIRLANPMH